MEIPAAVRTANARHQAANRKTCSHLAVDVTDRDAVSAVRHRMRGKRGSGKAQFADARFERGDEVPVFNVVAEGIESEPAASKNVSGALYDVSVSSALMRSFFSGAA